MLFSISRPATRQLASVAFSTSSTRSVIFRGIVKPQHQSSGIYRCSLHVARGFASVGRPKKASTVEGAESTATKKPTTKPTRSTKAKAQSKSKPKPKPKPKKIEKPISEEKRAKAEMKALKKIALFTEPKLLPHQPWLVVMDENIHKGEPNAAEKLIELGRKYKAMSSTERQRLESIAAQNKLANEAAYKAWLESHTVADIRAAILARQTLKKKYDFPKGHKHSKIIHDERQPKKPGNSFAMFTKARWASGEFENIDRLQATEIASGLARDWRNLTLAERQPYEDIAKGNWQEYHNAVQSALHRDIKKSASP